LVWLRSCSPSRGIPVTDDDECSAARAAAKTLVMVAGGRVEAQRLGLNRDDYEVPHVEHGA